MAEKKIVITGIGVIASNGIGKDSYFNSILNGVTGIKKVSLFDTSLFPNKTAGEITDFRAEEFLGAKGLRTLDRSTKLIASAAKLALVDANLEINEDNAGDIGVVVGSTLGSIASISDFHGDGIKEGPRYVNPALFANTVINSPASQVSIKFNIQGFNTTISSGFCAGLDALGYAADFLENGRAKFILAGGVEELCPQIYLAFSKAGCLSGSDGDNREISSPFDKKRNGAVFGEGACLLLLEELEFALARKAKIYARVTGFGTGFNPKKDKDGLVRAMKMAIEGAGLNREDIDCIFAGANSQIEADFYEAIGIRQVFSGDRQKVTAVKSMTGECFSASGALQAAAAVASVSAQVIPPTINYFEPDEACGLGGIVSKPENFKINNVLVNSFGPNGTNSSLVISKGAQ